MNMIDAMYQEEFWNKEENQIKISDMNSRHIHNVLNWIWRNRETLKSSAEASMAFGMPRPFGEAASDALDAAFEDLLQTPVNTWVRDLPLPQALARELRTRGESPSSVTFWLRDTATE
jgi:hypothetical protein